MLQSMPRPNRSNAAEGDLALMEREAAEGPAERIFSALDRLERLIAGYAPPDNAREAELEEEFQRLQEENARLRSERQELVQAVRSLKSQNDQLAEQMDEISERLDGAIHKISELMQE